MAPQSHQQQQQPNPQLCEEKIIASLRQAYPNHRFVGEESTFAGTADTGTDPATPTWYIDPVDGTTNFCHGALRSSPHLVKALRLLSATLLALI